MKNKDKGAKTRQKSGCNCDKEQKCRERGSFLWKVRCWVEAVFFPSDCRCIVCDKEIVRTSHYSMCPECEAKFAFNNGRICVKCGSPMQNEASYCLDCQNNCKHFDFARSSLVYEGDVQRLLLLLKFHNYRWLAKHFAVMMSDTYAENKLDAEVICPVPISRERQKERGYNQSMLLARHLSEMLGLPLVCDAVMKVVDNKRQTTLSGKERRNNVLGAYKLSNRKAVKGKKVLLVDDILTTGSTMSEVARQLRIAGAEAVYGLVVASPLYKVPTELNEDLTDFEVV